MSAESDFIESESETETDKDQVQKYYAFQPEHPLYKTHQVFIDESAEVIPNFAGGSLPRCDHGDREYYCATMLTLFKPWRSGKDLKDVNYSWDETFSSYVFTSRQKELMKFFNIRYECNDARDDFSKLVTLAHRSLWSPQGVLGVLEESLDPQGPMKESLK